jgi:hypothetical protein
MRRQRHSYYPRAPAAEALAPTPQMGSWRGTYVEDDCLDVGFVRHGVQQPECLLVDSQYEQQ